MMNNIDVSSDDGSVDIAVIESFEKEIGYCLPQNYKVLIASHDWLYPAQNSFDFINVYAQQDSRDIAFFGYGKEATRYSENITDNQDFDVYGYEGIIAFGCSANGDYICFDYRHDPKTCEPRVVLMYHDDYVEDANGNAHMVVNDVAPSFEAFIDMLYKYEDEAT